MRLGCDGGGWWGWGIGMPRMGEAGTGESLNQMTMKMQQWQEWWAITAFRSGRSLFSALTPAMATISVILPLLSYFSLHAALLLPAVHHPCARGLHMVKRDGAREGERGKE